MRIAIVVNGFPVISETFIVDQIVDLIDLGHEVDIISELKPSNLKKVHQKVLKYNLLSRTYYINISESRKERIVKAGIAVLKLFFKNPLIVIQTLDFRKFSRYEALNNLFRILPFVRKKYDVIHCHFGPVALNFIFIKKILGTKFVVTFHGYDISRIIKQNGAAVYQSLFKQADLLLPVSNYFKERLISLGCPAGKVTTLYQGLDMSEFCFHEKNSDFRERVRILTVGRLVEKKGMRYALLALEKVLKDVRNIQYVIIGEGNLRNELEDLSKKLGIQGHVQFVGSKTKEEIIKFYFNSDIFILPCVTSENGDEEGVPTVLKEALAMGIPIVSTYHAGVPELVVDGQTGFLVQEKDVDALAYRLKCLIDNPSLCHAMGLQGRKCIEDRFSIRASSKDLEKLYGNRCE